jgi:hypothetical protein
MILVVYIVEIIQLNTETEVPINQHTANRFEITNFNLLNTVFALQTTNSTSQHIHFTNLHIFYCKWTKRFVIFCLSRSIVSHHTLNCTFTVSFKARRPAKNGLSSLATPASSYLTHFHQESNSPTKKPRKIEKYESIFLVLELNSYQIKDI